MLPAKEEHRLVHVTLPAHQTPLDDLVDVTVKSKYLRVKKCSLEIPLLSPPEASDVSHTHRSAGSWALPTASACENLQIVTEASAMPLTLQVNQSIYLKSLINKT